MKISTAKILFKYLRVNSGTMNKFIKFIKFSVLFLFFWMKLVTESTVQDLVVKNKILVSIDRNETEKKASKIKSRMHKNLQSIRKT